MGEIMIGVGGIDANLAPDAFHQWATDYYKCKQGFKPSHRFSPVPYFLLCRAIELEIKSKHLKSKKQTEVKREYWHDLVRAYEGLDKIDKTLTDDEVQVLKRASEIYASKGFEYFDPEHALTGYSRYPDLLLLDAIARKLFGNTA